MSQYPYREDMSVTDKLFGRSELATGQAAMIKKTYLLLSLSVGTAVFGGYVGANSQTLLNLMSSWVGWIVALVIINVIPYIAMAARHNPVLGTAALLLDGFVAGLVLGPILAYAAYVVNEPGLIGSAFIITAIVFAAVTGYVMTSRKTFSASRGLMMGAFASMIGVMLLNMFLQMTFLSILISLGIGVFGVFILIYATSDVLNNPEIDSPIPGALMLFSGLFNVFVAALRLLLAFRD